MPLAEPGTDYLCTSVSCHQLRPCPTLHVMVKPSRPVCTLDATGEHIWVMAVRRTRPSCCSSWPILHLKLQPVESAALLQRACIKELSTTWTFKGPWSKFAICCECGHLWRVSSATVVWESLHVLLRTASSQVAMLCT